jgi:hypothetical protein
MWCKVMLEGRNAGSELRVWGLGFRVQGVGSAVCSWEGKRLWGSDDTGALAELHLRHALVPCLDHTSDPDHEVERLVAFPVSGFWFSVWCLLGFGVIWD